MVRPLSAQTSSRRLARALGVAAAIGAMLTLSGCVVAPYGYGGYYGYRAPRPVYAYPYRPYY